MPYAIKIKKKIILINSDTQAILDILDKVMGASKGKDETAQTGLAVSDTQEIPGLWKASLRVFEKITDVKVGALRTCVLNEKNVKLDGCANVLRDHYVNLINLVLNAKLVKPQKDGIADSDLLVREILVRFFSIALSNEFNAKLEGKDLAAKMQQFLDELVSKDGGKFISPELKRFLQTEHAKWMVFLRQMVDKIEDLHKNVAVISSFLDSLLETRYKIMRRLVIELCHSVTFEALEDERLAITLHAAESQVQQGKDKREESATNPANIHPGIMEDFYATYQTLRHRAVLTVLQSAAHSSSLSVLDIQSSRFKQVEKLYLFLYRTNTLMKTFQEIDSLCRTGSWLPFIAGIFDLTVLTQLINEYGIEKKAYDLPNLKLSQEAFAKDKLNVFMEACGEYERSLSATQLNLQAFGQDELFDQPLRARICQEIRSSFNAIVQMQQLLDVRLVNPRLVEELSRSLLTGRSQLPSQARTVPAIELSPAAPRGNITPSSSTALAATSSPEPLPLRHSGPTASTPSLAQPKNAPPPSLFFSAPVAKIPVSSVLAPKNPPLIQERNYKVRLGISSKIRTTAFLSNQILCCGTETGEIYCLPYPQLDDYHKQTGIHTGPIIFIQSFRDVIVSVSSKGEIRVWKWTGNKIETLPELTADGVGTICSAAIDQHGRLFLSLESGELKSVTINEARLPLTSYNMPQAAGAHLDIRDELLYLSRFDGKLIIFTIAGEKIAITKEVALPPVPILGMNVSNPACCGPSCLLPDRFIAVAESDNGKVINNLFARATYYAIYACNLDKKSTTTAFERKCLSNLHSNPILYVAVTQDQQYVISISKEAIKVWHARTLEYCFEEKMNDANVCWAQFSPDHVLVLGCENGTVMFYHNSLFLNQLVNAHNTAALERR